MSYDLQTITREEMLELIRLTAIKLKGNHLTLIDNLNAYKENYSEQALRLVNEYNVFADAVTRAFENASGTNMFDCLDDGSLRHMANLSLEISDAYELGVKIETKQKLENVEKVNEEAWKVYLDKNKKVIKVEYGTDKTKAQIIYSNGKKSQEIKLEGKDYEDKGFARKLLIAAGIEATDKANLEIQDRMLDDGLFYVNKDKGWIEKERYFKEMTPEDYLTIQDYKDVTVKAVYDDNEGKLTFTYTAGGKTEELFVITASNNQKKRDWPTKSGTNNTTDPNDIMYTTPPYGEKQMPYIPGEFPKGNWKITAFEKNETNEYGPYKIRTDAWREVEVWELVENKKKRLEWRKKRDSEGNIVTAKDAGLLIHGGGWSESDLDNKKGSNKYTDTTLGCIRISNLDVLLIEKTLNAYLNLKKIDLEVK